jgi:hypothetical protein
VKPALTDQEAMVIDLLRRRTTEKLNHEIDCTVMYLPPGCGEVSNLPLGDCEID